MHTGFPYTGQKFTQDRGDIWDGSAAVPPPETDGERASKEARDCPKA